MSYIFFVMLYILFSSRLVIHMECIYDFEGQLRSFWWFTLYVFGLSMKCFCIPHFLFLSICFCSYELYAYLSLHVWHKSQNINSRMCKLLGGFCNCHICYLVRWLDILLKSTGDCISQGHIFWPLLASWMCAYWFMVI